MPRDTLRYIVLCLLLAGAAVAQHSLPEQRAQTEPAFKPDWSTIPKEIAGWSDEDVPIDEEVARYLRAGAMLCRIYRKDGMTLSLSAVFGTRWRSVHSPVGCLFSQGWQVVKRYRTTIEPPKNCPHPGPLHAEVVIAKRDNTYKIVTYLYAYPGGTTADWVEQCLKITRGARKGGIVVIIECGGGLDQINKISAAEAELLRAIYPYLVGGWYKSG